MNINKTLGIEFPFIQGAMANITDGKFAAAVSNAGALGVIGSAAMTAEILREQIKICQSLTDKPFAVNLMLMNPESDLMAQVVVEEGVKFLTTGAGNPGKYIPSWKEAGIFIMPVVPAPILAKRMAQNGADAIIAEGTESGGHVGEMTTMTLTPQVVDTVDVPVIAAGGIADGRQLAAAALLGAQGVQIATCLLVSEECPIHDNYKQALIKASGSDTVVTGRTVGAPVRIIKNSMSKAYLAKEKEGADKMELEMFTLGGLRRAVFDGDVKTGSVMAGQTVGQLGSVRPLRDIFEQLKEEANDILSNIKGI